MKGNKEDLLRRVLIRPASQIGLEDGPISYFNQYTPSEERSSYEPVDNDDEILAELRRIRELLEYLPEIAKGLARLEEICTEIALCTEIATTLPSSKNVQTASSVRWGQKQDEARQLLIDLLTDNPEGVEVQRIMSEAEIRGISMKTMRRAKKSMGLKSEKRGTSWLWKLSDSE